MNPVDLIRELAAHMDVRERDHHETHYGNTEPFVPSVPLTRAQAFLAAHPVVVMKTNRMMSGDGLLFLSGLETGLPDDTAYDVYVVVTQAAP